MNKLTFRDKILLMLITCMCISQVSTMLATLVTTENTVRESVDKDLASAEAIFDQLFEQRYYQLSQSVEVLVNDFGFRSALASQDAPTIKSALDNHAQRATADLAIFIDDQDSSIVSTQDISGWQKTLAWEKTLAQINQNNYLFATVTLDKSSYQIVVVPVMSPSRIGWVLMGFVIDDTLAKQFRDMTGLHVSLFDLVSKYKSNIVSTLDNQQEQLLIEALQNFGNMFTNKDDGFEIALNEEQFLTHTHLLKGSATPIYAILQKSLQEEMKPYYQMKNKLLMLFGQVLFVAVLGSIFIGNSIIAPVKKLAAVAERIGKGNYGIEIKINSKDELGRLGTTLNTMQQEIAKRENRIVYQSQHDELTGLPNRYLVRDRLQNAIDRADRHARHLTVVMLDIARFKQINDTLGHHIGDIVLKETANRIRKRQRKTDTIARMGGDDFLLLLENTSLQTSMDIVRYEIQPLISSAINVNGIDVQARFYFGFAEYPAHGDTATTLLRRAEIALYEAKSLPERMATYQPGRDESHIRELAIVSDLDRALKQGELSLHYQPKINLATGEIRHAEALVRWTHPEFGFLPPDEFITVLEQTGNINRLTEWVVNEAARQCRVWLDQGLRVEVSLNLSTLDLNPQLLNVIGRCTAKHLIEADQLILEVTESAIMHDPQSARTYLNELRDAGYRIAIDDFGTGYSSLMQLKRLPLDELKIDKSFVLNLTEDSQDAVIVKSTIELAHSMNLKVVAEGVETAEGLALLRAYGCNMAQGYLFSKPLPAKDFEKWLVAQDMTPVLEQYNAA